MVADRRVDFGYAHCWIICPSCTDRTRLTFEQYVTGERVRCVRCGVTVTTEDEHDLAVSAPDDVALDPSALSGVAWYHTSTYREWPPMNEEPTDSAIHLGTYEAAIENMLRRMRNESDADSQFHLHRITLCVDAKDVTDVRGEASNWFGLTAQSVVRADGHRVLRYINRHEHKGSISLAVVPPSVIATVQTVTIHLRYAIVRVRPRHKQQSRMRPNAPRSRPHVRTRLESEGSNGNSPPRPPRTRRWLLSLTPQRPATMPHRRPLRSFLER